MAKLQTFQETWDGGIIHPQWVGGFNTGTMSIVNGQLVISMPSGNTLYRGFDSPNFSLIDSYFSSRLVDAGNQALISLEVYPVQLVQNSSNTVWFMVNAGNVYIYKKVANAVTQITSVSYNALTHNYFRIRESNGICYWETSPDGITWNTLYSEANPITMTSVYHEVAVGTWQAEATSTIVIMDDFNYVRTNKPGNLLPNVRVGNGMGRSG